MAEQSAQQEPSMEEILASIRRIISEDAEDEAAGDAPASGPQAVAADPAPVDPEPEEVGDDTSETQETASDEVEAEEPEAEAASDDDLGFDPIEEPEPVDVAEPAPEPEPEPEPESAFEPTDSEPVMAAEDEEGDDVLELTQMAPGGTDPIVSHTTETQASEHLQALSGLLVRSYPGSENTLEGLVREMLKPMLREWLDANLPQLVEKSVNREIARIAGRDK